MPSGVLNVQTNLSYIYSDHIDTPRVIVRSNDHAIQWRWDQAEAYGNTPPNDNPNGLGSFAFNLRFPGQLFDSESNLVYNVNRCYDASTGRYVESDPIGIAGGINTYSYVGGNPVSRVDPTGLFDPGTRLAAPEAATQAAQSSPWPWPDLVLAPLRLGLRPSKPAMLMTVTRGSEKSTRRCERSRIAFVTCTSTI